MASPSGLQLLRDPTSELGIRNLCLPLRLNSCLEFIICDVFILELVLQLLTLHVYLPVVPVHSFLACFYVSSVHIIAVLPGILDRSLSLMPLLHEPRNCDLAYMPCPSLSNFACCSRCILYLCYLPDAGVP